MDSPAFEALLEDLKQIRGFDFTGYKRSSLRRRIARRMAQVGIDDVAAYHDHLRVHPEEFVQLFNTILINVTSFFRDDERWTYLAEEVLPQVVEAAGNGPIRVWSAGCASGEEPYTIAILLAELLGVEALEGRVKIYATDVDEDALRRARQAVYDGSRLEAVPPDLREKYFEPVGSQFVVGGDLRRAVIFGRHDLVSDAPISNLHLLVCRNVLMYFNSETQLEVLRNLHYGLRDDGFLFLGKAEMLLTRTDIFEPVELSQRVFRKAEAAAPSLFRLPTTDRIDGAGRVSRLVRLRDAAFAAAPVAQVVVDADAVVSLVNGQARSAFGIGAHDVGRPLQELELSYRPVDLRGPLEEVRRDRHPVQLHDVVPRRGEGEVQHFEVGLVPLFDGDGVLAGVSITFEDVTGPQELRTRLQQSNQELETAYEELQSTNEELETTNEELQSTVEELETMNEELQSANSEQEEINHELMVRTEEVEQVNAYFQSILHSVQAGVVVVGTDFEVEIWNEQAFELWGLREEEVVGRSVLALDIGLPMADLADSLRSTMRSGEVTEVVVPATSRRGRSIECRVRLTPLVDEHGARRGVVVLMEPEPAHHAGHGS